MSGWNGYRADRVVYDEVQDFPEPTEESISGDALRELMQEWWHTHD